VWEGSIGHWDRFGDEMKGVRESCGLALQDQYRIFPDICKTKPCVRANPGVICQQGSHVPDGQPL